MGVTKKPAVKTARKFTITAMDAKFAKDAGIPMSVVAKAKLPKRGRPVGSKNKPKAWPFPTDKDVDLAKLLDKTQEALAIEMKTVQALEGLFEDFKSKVVIAEKMSLFGRIKFVFTGKL